MPLPDITNTSVAKNYNVKTQQPSIFGVLDELKKRIVKSFTGPQLTGEQYKEAQRIAEILRGDGYGMMAGYRCVEEDDEYKTLREIQFISLDNLGRVPAKVRKACGALLKNFDPSTNNVKNSNWYKA